MTRRLLFSCACLLSAAGLALAQFGSGAAEWVTSGSDAQRSHSIPADPKISVDNLQKPGFQLLWKTKLDNEPVQLNSLTPAILMDRYIGYRGFRSFAFVAGSSNAVYAIDTDLNHIEWRKRFPVSAAPAGTVACPGGLTSAATRPTSAGYPAPGVFGGLGGRAGPARSDVGLAGEGAVTIAPALLRMTADGGPPRPPGGPRLPAVIYVVSSDGKLHTLNVSNGDEPGPPIEFLPPNSNAQGLVVIDNIAYAATHDCNGAPAGVWALDIASKQLTHWQPASGDIAGSGGPAFGPDGALYVTTTAGELVALAAKGLAIQGAYAAGQAFTSSPIVFPYKERNLIAAATKDGRIHVVDAAGLETPLAKTEPYSNFSPQALASWQSPAGVRWLLAAPSGVSARGLRFSGAITHGAVAAWKIVDHNGEIALEPGWVSQDLVSPLPLMIINGVVFALSSGEYRSDDNAVTAGERVQRSSPAVLYALDGATGKVLWNSGNTIASFVHSGGLSGGASQLYLATYDGTVYAFGFPMEH
jgi:outer membrane protein assembly factor BamB